MRFIRFKPVYFERVWGGDGLKKYFNRPIPNDSPTGESWEISDRPEAVSVAEGGKFDGMKISDILKENPLYIMGKDFSAPFPVLVKWIYAEQALSIQVHPSHKSAKQLNAESKNENWYIADAKAGANIIAGFNEGIKSVDSRKLSDGKWLRENLRKIDVEPGDSVFIRGGCVHAIGAGNLILEIQENSDTTYRLYDWDRMGTDGKPRKLHIEESAKCVDLSMPPPQIIKSKQCPGKIISLCDFPLFKIERVKLQKSESLNIESGTPKILSVVEGSLTESGGGTAGLSENVLIPAGESPVFSANDYCEFLLTTITI